MADLTDQIIGVESGGNRYDKNPLSSAYGPGQFISSTWLDMVRRYRPDLAQGRTTADILALRSNPLISRQMTNAYAQENGQKLQAAGFDPTPGNTYLAHFAGPGGAISVLRADPGAPIGQVLGQQAVAANPFMRNMTAGDLRSWANRKMGAPTPPADIPVQGTPSAAIPTGPQEPGGSAMPASVWRQADSMSGAPPMLTGFNGGNGGQPLGMLSPAASYASAAPQSLSGSIAPPPPTIQQPSPDRLAAAALGVGQMPQWWFDRQNTTGG